MKEPPIFVTSNRYKKREYTRIFRSLSIDLSFLDEDIEEIQTVDIKSIIRDKMVKAYAVVRRPVIVEHSSLSMSALNGLPEGLTKPFWDRLKDVICDIAFNMHDAKAKSIVTLGFCNGQNFYITTKDVTGLIARKPYPGEFHLDQVFIPKGATKAIAAMNSRDRDRHSPRYVASKEFVRKHIQPYLGGTL